MEGSAAITPDLSDPVDEWGQESFPASDPPLRVGRTGRRRGARPEDARGSRFASGPGQWLGSCPVLSSYDRARPCADGLGWQRKSQLGV